MLALRYLALGDSYTIGESVMYSERFPVQTVKLLRAAGIDVADPLIIARTGWTCKELAEGIGQKDPHGPFDLVSLLIGVNDQYRGMPVEGYVKDFQDRLDQAIGFAAGKVKHVFVLSIPDWGVMPFAEGRDRYRIAKDIDGFNAVNRELSEKAGVHYLDITPLTRNATTDTTLIADDGLHPSGKAYGQWAELLAGLMRSETISG